jgi:hypothetical protein
MKWTSVILLCVTLFAGMAPAADSPERAEHGTLWWSSVAAMIASSALDTHSSWGRQELNPVLANGNGAFGGRAIAIKVGLAASIAGAQYLLLRGNRRAQKYVSLTNFGLAGAMAGVAVHNYSNQGKSSSLPAYMANTN